MKLKHNVCLQTLTFFTFLAASTILSANDSHDVFGEFWVEDRGSKILISDCGDGTPCGKVTWIDPNTLEPGQTPETVKTKAGKSILGLQLLHGFEKKKNDWRGGKIYSPQADKTYSSRLKRLSDGELQVKGCIAFLCETQKWIQVDQ
ncbi:MAG: DUF2147 domain-containing protein [Acidiferrobacterales bacterium]|nr:DUF2147 domain-containing protein [Acidiferrobacterales bacterium]